MMSENTQRSVNMLRSGVLLKKYWLTIVVDHRELDASCGGRTEAQSNKRESRDRRQVHGDEDRGAGARRFEKREVVPKWQKYKTVM
jgi:hypothetical protein